MSYPVWDGVYKRNLAAYVAAAGFLSRYLSVPLPYVRQHITVNKVLSASLNKTLPVYIFSIVFYLMSTYFL